MAKNFSEAENEAYKRGLAAGKKKGGKSSSSKSKGKKSGEDAPKRSGCTYEANYKDKDGNPTGRPKIWGWRLSKRHGFQKFTAYLGKDDGKPQNGTSEEVCRVFVVNIITEGVGEQTATGVWSMQHKKLSITKLGLVANPSAPRGGYFGRGGERYKDKVK